MLLQLVLTWICTITIFLYDGFLSCHAFISISQRQQQRQQQPTNNPSFCFYMSSQQPPPPPTPTPPDDNDDDNDFLLDKMFFNPDEYNENDTGPLAWFANLVKSDYELAETLYVGTMVVVLVIATQEVLRMQLYGDAYMPFTRVGSVVGTTSKLF